MTADGASLREGGGDAATPNGSASLDVQAYIPRYTKAPADTVQNKSL